MTKAIERVFQPDNVNTLKFMIRKMNVKKYNSLSELDKKDAMSFLNDCERDIQRFKKELNIKKNK